MDFAGIGMKAFRAAKLDVDLYEEVEADESATVEAAVVVVGASLLSGLGLMFTKGITALILGTILALLSWVIWAFLTYFVGTRLFKGTADIVGTRLFKGTADMGEMLRVLGFAYAPRALGIIPVVGGIIGAIWALVAMVVAVRQGLDFDTPKAIGTVAVGFVISFFISLILAVLFGIAGVAAS
jgi:hypothetical protein